MTLHAAVEPHHHPRVECFICHREVPVYLARNGGGTVRAHQWDGRLCMGGGHPMSAALLRTKLVADPPSPGRPAYLTCDADSGLCPARFDHTGSTHLSTEAADAGWAAGVRAGSRRLDYCPGHRYRAEAT